MDLKMSSNEYTPILVSLLFILGIGLIYPFVLGFFMPVNTVVLSPMGSAVVGVVTNGITILGVSINPFSLLPFGLQGDLSNSLTYIGILPDFVQIGAYILIVVSLAYGLMKLIRG
jgi:hypothetical protein